MRWDFGRCTEVGHERVQFCTMGVRSSLTVEHVVLTALGVGFASFILVHSAALLQGGTEQTLSMIRGLWFAGLAITAILVLSHLLER